MEKIPGIIFENVKLRYELSLEGRTSIKETVLNFLHRRNFQRTDAKYHDAISDLNLTIYHGDRLGIVGQNGAGKSTLLKIISGVLKPTSGSIKINGKVQPLIEIAAGFNPEFSGRENIYLNGYMLGFTKAQIKEKEAEIIEFTELGKFIDVAVKYYSSGMSVRLAFAIATSIDPDYLILDEMLSAGDTFFVIKAERRLHELIKKANLMVVVSHSHESILNLTNRCLVLEQGKIVFDGPPDEALKFYYSIRPVG